jgi:hypothetical protein
MKKKSILLLSLLVACTIARADRMMDIIQGYNANTMSVAQMDSVLDNATGKESVSRYRLEYKEEQKLFRHSFYAEYYSDNNRNYE